MAKSKPPIIPTDSELEILQILWQKKEASVREVYDIILLTKQSVYTSTLKIMQKMTAKGLIGRKIKDQLHLYHPLVEEQKIANHHVKQLITKFFNGSYSSLALHALGHSTKDENIDELIEVLKDLKKPKK